VFLSSLDFLRTASSGSFKYLQNQRTVGSGSLGNKFWLPSISGFHERTDDSSVGSFEF
jgi:hypothetical protein